MERKERQCLEGERRGGCERRRERGGEREREREREGGRHVLAHKVPLWSLGEACQFGEALGSCDTRQRVCDTDDESLVCLVFGYGKLRERGRGEGGREGEREGEEEGERERGGEGSEREKGVREREGGSSYSHSTLHNMHI